MSTKASPRRTRSPSIKIEVKQSRSPRSRSRSPCRRNEKEVVKKSPSGHKTTLCVRSPRKVSGGRSPSPVRIGPLDKGTLRKHGYSVNKSTFDRRKAIDSAIREYGATTVQRKLQAVSTLQKNTSPYNSAILKQDAEYASMKRSM